MSNSIKQRLRRNRKTRIKISNTNRVRLSVHRTNLHIYAQLLDTNGSKILASASSLEKAVRKDLDYGGNISAAVYVGKRIAEKAKGLKIVDVAFDRSGNKYHGRVKALADSARESGLKF